MIVFLIGKSFDPKNATKWLHELKNFQKMQSKINMIEAYALLTLTDKRLLSRDFFFQVHL